MRNRFHEFKPVLGYIGILFLLFSGVILIPYLVGLLYGETDFLPYFIPSVLFFVLGLIMKRHLTQEMLTVKQSMLVCILGWSLVSAVGAFPFCLGLGSSYINALFETVSGFTTTGITMFTGLDSMPRGILFWRALTQWLGGLGILSFFMLIIYMGGTPHALIGAEAHKIASHRPKPGMFNTLRILWKIYGGLTILCAILLKTAGMDLFDAIYHALTCLSTGGYSTYDASIDHFRQIGFRNYRAIEYILSIFMILGGTNFLIHYRVIKGEFKSLILGYEMRLWWRFLLGSVILVMGSHWLMGGNTGLEELFRTSLFQVSSLSSTTGFGTRDINDIAFYGPMAQQIFLVWMFIGGCVGSTGGGFKVLRVGILIQSMKRQIRAALRGSSRTNLVVIDETIINSEEIRRVSGLLFGWLLLILIGGFTTAALAGHDPWSSFSGMFSAVGNIGPSFLSVDQTIALPTFVKLVYIIGMLAGRLEIIPVLVLLSPKMWK